MYRVYLSHAVVRRGSSRERLAALTKDLEIYGCSVRAHPSAKRLDLEIPKRAERWIVLGGLNSL